MNNKNAQNFLILGAVIFVTIAVIVFVISLSVSGGGSSAAYSSASGSNASGGSHGLGSGSGESSATESAAAGSSHGAESAATGSNASGSASGSNASGSHSSGGFAEMSRGQAIIENARLLLGVPFKDGGQDENGFDSSGFIYFVMRQSGFISCPRSIVKQSEMGVMREFDEVGVGDVMFFSNDPGGKPNFAGFYSGNGKMIGCLVTSSFEGVVEININSDYYRSRFVTAVGIS